MSSNLPAMRLNEKQAAFVAAVSRGLPMQEACQVSGYARNGYIALLRSPAVLAALELELRRVLHGQLVPLAFQVIENILKNPEASERVRLDAARMVLDRGGFAPLKQQDSTSEREPEAMSTSELHALIAQLERELGDRAKPVTP